MSDLVERKKEIAERVANMVVFGAAAESIMLACGLTEEQLQKVQSWPEYIDAATEASSARFEQQRMVDEGWDFLEAKSLENLCKVVEFNKDPDLNLRVARVANQASRSHRGKRNTEQPINPLEAPKTVVLNLGVQFVQNIQQREIGPRAEQTVEIGHKDIDCLSQGDVENVFGISGRNVLEDVTNEFIQEFA